MSAQGGDALRQAQGPEGAAQAPEGAARLPGPCALMLESREVPLGGVRAMEVHRSLPQRELPLVGAWCFLDRFGPQMTRMRVEPHPHIGLQTVTWPYEGEVHHRDSVGSDVVVRRGALNLMTSGTGISHSEYSVGEADVPLDALQLWVALPESRRHGPPLFEQHDELPTVPLEALRGEPGVAVVVLGEFAGAASPASAFTPIVGAEIRVPAGSRVRLPLRTDWEHALVAVDGDVRVHTGATPPDGEIRDAAASGPGEKGSIDLERLQLLYLGTHREELVVDSSSGATLFLLGGEPFEDDIVMWWNFVGRTHEEIVAARDAWESRDARFGHVVGHGDERVPAPPLPAVRLTQRRRGI